MQMADWISVLVAHLLRCPSSIESAVDHVTPEDLQSVHGFTTALLWTFSKEYFEKYNKVIPRTTLESELVQYNAGTWLLDSSVDEVADFILWVYSIPEEDFNPEEAAGYVRRLLEKTRVHRRIQEMALGIEDTDVSKMAAEITAGVEQASVGHAEVIDPMMNIESMLGASPPDPVGGTEVSYFNRLCSGGIRPGEVAVLLGPTGGFKTTMALDICCAMANAQEQSMYITYEQAFKDGDLGMRIAARMSNIGKDRLESNNIDTLTQEERNRIAEAKKKSHYITFLDRSSNIDMISDIGGFVRNQERLGKKPRLVVIDQLLQWVGSWPGVDHDNLRKECEGICNLLKHQVASKYGTSILLLHQLSAKLAGGSSTKIPHHSDSADCKSIAFWADFGIAMGNLDKEENVLWINSSKHRRGEGDTLLVRPYGNLCHLVACDDIEVSKSNKFVKKGGASNMVSNTMTNRPPKGGSPVLSKRDV